MQIPLIIVDDELVDRMVVVKRLSRSERGEMFQPVFESATGDEFLSEFLGTEDGRKVLEERPLVLMDVNMPGRNGFETVEELAKQIKDHNHGAVVMMFTSSQNQADIEKAESLELVKGYIVKPFSEDHVRQIAEFYDIKSAE